MWGCVLFLGEGVKGGEVCLEGGVDLFCKIM